MTALDFDAFITQNDLSARMSAENQERVAQFASHHCGGLFVLIGSTPTGSLVKMHDSWGDTDEIVVHTYDPEDFDDSVETEVYFTDPDRAVAAFTDALNGATDA